MEAAGRKRDGSVGGDFEGAPAALTAAAAGLLDDESFFRHFFGSLVGGGDSVSGALRSSVEDVGDSCDARILEQVCLALFPCFCRSCFFIVFGL